MHLNNRLVLLLIILAMGTCFSSCKEPFDPQVEFAAPLFAVDGLITTQEKEHLVKIHYAQNYNEAQVAKPVVGAEVFVRDQDQNMILLQEKQPGHYYTPLFQAVVGADYVLHVHTQEGFQMRSRPQEVLPVANIDSIYGQTANRSIMEINNYGDHYFYSYQGGESIINISQAGDQVVKMRYVPRILLLYAYQVPNRDFPAGAPMWMNCWKKLGAQGLPNVTHLGQQTAQGGLKNHLLLFVPDNKRYYNLEEDQVMVGRYLIIGQYRLNDDSHAFHKSLVKQLGAEGSLFDPIASQLPGNMICTSDPDQKILGFFEVSSYNSETFRYLVVPEREKFTYTPYDDLDHIPASGELYDETPFFW